METCLVLTHRPTGVRAEAGERRSLSENQAMALRRLRLRLAIEVRANRDLKSVPSPLWQSRCRDGRISVNENHEDYPSLLAEALDLLQQAGWDPKPAGETLTCTPSQLLKFLKQEPQAWTALLAHRRQNGLPDLH